MIKAKPMENRTWPQTRRSHMVGKKRDAGTLVEPELMVSCHMRAVVVVSDQSALGCPE